VLRVAALQIRHPVGLGILVKPDDSPLHLLCWLYQRLGTTARGTRHWPSSNPIEEIAERLDLVRLEALGDPADRKRDVMTGEDPR
jgi:hypothetical protein